MRMMMYYPILHRSNIWTVCVPVDTDGYKTQKQMLSGIYQFLLFFLSFVLVLRCFPSLDATILCYLHQNVGIKKQRQLINKFILYWPI